MPMKEQKTPQKSF